MKIYLKDIYNISDEKVYEFYYDRIDIENSLFVRRLEKVDGYFIFYYEGEDNLKVEYKIIGNMICPDAYTLEDVEVGFDEEGIETVVTSFDADGIYFSTTNEDIDIIKQIIMPIVPIKVVKK